MARYFGYEFDLTDRPEGEVCDRLLLLSTRNGPEWIRVNVKCSPPGSKYLQVNIAQCLKPRMIYALAIHNADKTDAELDGWAQTSEVVKAEIVAWKGDGSECHNVLRGNLNDMEELKAMWLGESKPAPKFGTIL